MPSTSDHLATVTATRAAAKQAQQAADQAVVDAYLAGASLAQLAEAMGVASQNAPRMLLRGRGVKLRPPGRSRPSA